MSKKKIKLGFFSGSRSEFGLISDIFLEAQKRNLFDVKLYLSGSHFKSEYGNTLKEIEDDNINIVLIDCDILTIKIVYKLKREISLSAFIFWFNKKITENIKIKTINVSSEGFAKSIKFFEFVSDLTLIFRCLLKFFWNVIKFLLIKISLIELKVSFKVSKK